MCISQFLHYHKKQQGVCVRTDTHNEKTQYSLFKDLHFAFISVSILFCIKIIMTKELFELFLFVCLVFLQFSSVIIRSTYMLAPGLCNNLWLVWLQPFYFNIKHLMTRHHDPSIYIAATLYTSPNYNMVFLILKLAVTGLCLSICFSEKWLILATVQLDYIIPTCFFPNITWCFWKTSGIVHFPFCVH